MHADRGSARRHVHRAPRLTSGACLVAVVSASKQSVLSTASAVVRTAPGPVGLARPTIVGTLEQGRRLAGGAGTWTGSGRISYAYQWSRCDLHGAHCTTIRGATRTTYTEVAADVAHTLGLAVRATDSTGVTTAYSSLAGVVAAPSTAAARTQPAAAGIPAVGQTLAVTGGRFTTAAESLAYAWLRCNANGRVCVPIAGALSERYAVTRDDAGHALVARVTATTAGVKAVVLTTAATIPS